MEDAERILIVGALLSAALAASLVAGRLRLPGLVLFLGLGMLVGSDGLGWIDFSNFHLAETIGVVALALILFEGGLAAGWGEIRPVLRPAIGLALPGTIITAAVAGWRPSWLFDFSTVEGLLLGSIVASTDGAAVFALLRGAGAAQAAGAHAGGRGGLQRPDRRAARARVHRVGAASRLRPARHAAAVRAAARDRPASSASRSACSRARRSGACSFSTPGLYPVASLAAAALAFGSAATLDGSGFLAVYLAGLALGSADLPAQAHRRRRSTRASRGSRSS